MCWQCDNPDATTDDYLDLVRGVIDRSGWFVQAVGAGRWQPPFAYTVGLTELGIPELLVTGLKHQVAHELLNGFAHHWVHHTGGSARPGERLRLLDQPAIEVVAVSEPSVHLVFAGLIYGPSLSAHQLVWADDRGRWPWEVGFRGNQAVLGPRAPQAPGAA